jgi:hypothetical protein
MSIPCVFKVECSGYGVHGTRAVVASITIHLKVELTQQSTSYPARRWPAPLCVPKSAIRGMTLLAVSIKPAHWPICNCHLCIRQGVHMDAFRLASGQCALALHANRMNKCQGQGLGLPRNALLSRDILAWRELEARGTHCKKVNPKT